MSISVTTLNSESEHKLVQEIKWDPFNRRYAPVFLCAPEYNRNKTRVIGWKFKCLVCKKNHSHSPYEGFRVAHCEGRKSYKTERKTPESLAQG